MRSIRRSVSSEIVARSPFLPWRSAGSALTLWNLRRFGRRPPAAVTQIDQHAELVHVLNNCSAEWRETAILALETSVAKFAATVVGELDDTYAEVVHSRSRSILPSNTPGS